MSLFAHLTDHEHYHVLENACFTCAPFELTFSSSFSPVLNLAISTTHSTLDSPQRPAAAMTTKPMKLPQLIASLPQEIWDKIYYFTFEHNIGASVTIDNIPAPPATFQVDRTSRIICITGYYSNTHFHTDNRKLLISWLGLMARSRHVHLLQDVEFDLVKPESVSRRLGRHEGRSAIVEKRDWIAQYVEARCCRGDLDRDMPYPDLVGIIGVQTWEEVDGVRSPGARYPRLKAAIET